MRKHNVFLVTGRATAAPRAVGDGRSEIQQRVLCAADEGALHEFARAAFPDFAVIGVVNLMALEETMGQVRAALAGAPHALPVFVDPALPR